MRRALLALAISAALGIAAVALAVRLVDGVRLEALVLDRLAAAAGAEIETEAPVALALWPRPRVQLGHVRARLGAATLEVAEADLVLDLGALARGRFGVAEARLRAAGLAVPTLPALERLAPVLAALGPELRVDGGELRVGTAPPLALATVSSRRDDAARSLVATGRWKGRAVRLDSRLAGPATAPRLERLVVAAGEDRLRFLGSLEPGAGAGEIGLETADVAALRRWLPPLPLVPLLDTALAALDGPLTLTADLFVVADHSRLEALELKLAEARISGRVGYDGGLDASLAIATERATLDLARTALRALRAAPDLLGDVRALAVDGADLRLRLERDDAGGLAASARLGLAGNTELTLDGRVALPEGRFRGPLSLRSDDPAALVPQWARFLPADTGTVSLSGELDTDLAGFALGAARLAATSVAFAGDVRYAPMADPALHVAGRVERIRLPTIAVDAPLTGATRQRLWAVADAGGVALDLELGRIDLGLGPVTRGRIVGQLDGKGLWLTALEMGGRAASVSLTGAVTRRPETVELLGAIDLHAPARALTALHPAAERLAGLAGGRLELVASGPVRAADVGLEGRLDDLEIALDGTVDLTGEAAPAGEIDLAHPDVARLLVRLGWPPHPARPLSGPVRLEGAAVSGASASLDARLSIGGLAGRISVMPEALRLSELSGPIAGWHGLLTALTPWPAEPERWRRRHQGDWPATGALVAAWPHPRRLEVEIAGGGLTDDLGRRARIDLALAVSPERIVLDRLSWHGAEADYSVAGEVRRGRRGLALAGSLALADRLDAPLPRALGLGWLGPGLAAVEGTIAARGVSLAELLADLNGTLRVTATAPPRRLRTRDGRPIRLPAQRLDGTAALVDGRYDVAGLAADGPTLDGTVDLFAGRLAISIDGLGGEAPRIVVEGRLGEPRWRRLAP